MPEVRTLADACSDIVDCAHKTAPIDDDGEYFAVGTPAMRGHKIDYAEARRISRATFDEWTQRLRPKAGDLLLAREAPVGPVVVIPVSENVAPGQRTVLLRPRTDAVDGRFLYYYLTSPSIQAALQVKASGSTVPHLNVADVRTLPTPGIPDVKEQRAIAQLLGALDDKIAANDHLIGVADNLAEARTRGALSGEQIPLSEAASLVMGSSPPGTSYNETGEGTPFYQGVRDFGVRFPSRRVWTTSPVRLAERSDTLISVRAPVGRTNLAAERMCLGRGVAGLRSKKGCAMTLFHQVRAAGDVWAPFEAVGTVFGAINKRQLESIALPAIDDLHAERLETDLVALEDRIAGALAENDRLAAARDQLLPLLMAGKVRVRDAEKVVEGVA